MNRATSCYKLLALGDLLYIGALLDGPTAPRACKEGAVLDD